MASEPRCPPSSGTSAAVVTAGRRRRARPAHAVLGALPSGFPAGSPAGSPGGARGCGGSRCGSRCGEKMRAPARCTRAATAVPRGRRGVLRRRGVLPQGDASRPLRCFSPTDLRRAWTRSPPAAGSQRAGGSGRLHLASPRVSGGERCVMRRCGGACAAKRGTGGGAPLYQDRGWDPGPSDLAPHSCCVSCPHSGSHLK